MKWDARTVLDFLASTADEDGFAIRQTVAPHGLRSAAERKFGSWAAACEKAGVKVRPRGRPRETTGEGSRQRGAERLRSQGWAR